MEPTGTLVFATVGRTDYGFDIFSVRLPSDLSHWDSPTDRRLTDGRSVNYNGQFVGDDLTLVYVSERTGSARIYLTASGDVQHLYSPPESLFHDRPLIKDDRLYFISAHEKPDRPISSWSALYFRRLHEKHTVRLTPYGSVDFSPAVSQSGMLIAVASYGSRPWAGEFHDLLTDIVVFQESDPTKRVVLCNHGGWPTWSGDSTIYFHRQADDGWWSIFRVDLPDGFVVSSASSDSLALAPVRVTPAGVHCFTPAAMHDRNRVVVATRRKDNNCRHIEIFDVESHEFYQVTQLINPNLHHYNPFVSSNSNVIGYHRFRGEGVVPGDTTIPNLDLVTSPIPGLHLFRLNGNFPSFSPSGDLIAFNSDFEKDPGLKIVTSDGSKRWSLFDDRAAFYNSWSPADENVIFTSIGPIFASESTSVQIGRVTFDPAHPSSDNVSIKILTKEGTGNNAFPASSPDGRSVVFRSGRSGHKNLYIVDAMKGESEGIFQLTEGAWTDTMPSWSPDGELIAFSSNRHNPDRGNGFGIYVVRPDGSDLRRVSVGGGDMERLNHVYFCGESGEWLVLTANLGGITAEAVAMPNQFQPYGELYMVRLDGSELQRLTWNGYEDGTPAWHPKNLAVLAQAQAQAQAQAEEEALKGEFDEPLWIKCDL